MGSLEALRNIESIGSYSFGKLFYIDSVPQNDFLGISHLNRHRQDRCIMLNLDILFLPEL